MEPLSVVIPAFNEEASLARVVTDIRRCLEAAGITHEIVVVVDGATDNTAQVAAGVADQVVEHPQNMGYGRSLKSGILAARHELIAIMDADGTYPPSTLPELLKEMPRCDMVVGARTGRYYTGGLFKRIGRWAFRRLAEFSAGQKIPDINSGIRIFRRGQMLRFFPVISAGFSFTTTSTLAYLHNDLLVVYVPIAYNRRSGRSHVRYVRDSLRAFQIIVEAILRCNPIKIFLLLALPYAAAGLVLCVWALIAASGLLALAGVLVLCTAGAMLALGFLAVAVGGRSRAIEPGAVHIRSTRCEDKPHDSLRPTPAPATYGRGYDEPGDG